LKKRVTGSEKWWNGNIDTFPNPFSKLL